MISSEVNDRRQRAREAAWDNSRLDDHTEIPDVEAAIETATRVKITHQVIAAFRPGVSEGSETWHKLRRRLTSAFEAAGFEVEL